jgi:hypothetical protein
MWAGRVLIFLWRDSIMYFSVREYLRSFSLAFSKRGAVLAMRA